MLSEKLLEEVEALTLQLSDKVDEVVAEAMTLITRYKLEIGLDKEKATEFANSTERIEDDLDGMEEHINKVWRDLNASLDNLFGYIPEGELEPEVGS